MSKSFSLIPGFSPVQSERETENRFNGFFASGKPLKRLARLLASSTRLKPGVNESDKTCCPFLRNSIRRRSNPGFSLTELLCVMAIIGVLAGLYLGVIGKAFAHVVKMFGH